MKKSAIVLTLIAILALLGTVYLRTPSSVPPGQEPLVVLSNANVGEFENAFDGDSDVPRLVLLLSPT